MSVEEVVGLSEGAKTLLKRAEEIRGETKGERLGSNHLLLALVTRHGAMAENLVEGLNAASLKWKLYTELRNGQLGVPLEWDFVASSARERARMRGKDTANESDVAAVILKAAGYECKEEGMKTDGQEDFVIDQADQPADKEDEKTSDEGASPKKNVKKTSAAYSPRSTKKTPVLDQYGRDLTKDAVLGKISPILGRDAEIRMVIETLCRKTKRNPVLVGDAGVGKTAVVEGFADRVAKGGVPPLLQGVRVITVQPSSLAAGATYSGEFEKRMKGLLEEAKQDGIILFIDEVHSIVGAGGRTGSTDFASLLKPALAREDVACIAATTSDEYRRYIEPDAALERRFQPVYVPELPPAETLVILTSLRDEFERKRGVRVADEALQWLVDFAGSNLRVRRQKE